MAKKSDQLKKARKMSKKQLKEQIADLRKGIVMTQVGVVSGKEKKTSKLKEERKELARNLTVLRQKELEKNSKNKGKKKAKPKK